MDETNQQSNLWSNAHAYVLSAVCLLLGLVIGYLLNPPKQSAASLPQASPAAGVMQGGMPTPDQLRHMADKKAEPIFAALQKDPNNADLLSQVGGVYFRAQQFPVAVEYYERATKIKPSAEGLVSLANSYHYAGSDDRSIETLQRAVQLDPKSANALYNLGMLNWQVKNDPKAAVEAWERLLKTNPDHPRRAEVKGMIGRARKHMTIPAGMKTDKPAN
jgi:cytochrome c-type biogenesis protein CcmH/NrfG